jgi:hypothetical protein
LQGVSLEGRRVSEHLVFYHFPSIDLLYYADLAQPELRDLYELVGTLNMWVPISTPINQSMVYNLECFVLLYLFSSPHPMTGTLGGGKGMGQGVEWTQFTWLLITYV